MALITVDLDDREREACDEMRRFLALDSDAALLRTALYKLALWCEPAADPAYFRLHRPPAAARRRQGALTEKRGAGLLHSRGAKP